MHDATTRYRYDGQMGVEDAETSSSGTTVTRYGLGARGVDLIERTGSSGTVTAFPLYDAHGNNVASLTRDGSGGYSLGDRRSYDAWGVVRSQQSGGDPKLRYCGSLGHKADDEGAVRRAFSSGFPKREGSPSEAAVGKVSARLQRAGERPPNTSLPER